jgi:uncharacterized membrane protein YphA (DoxX/SURF4 family)
MLSRMNAETSLISLVSLVVRLLLCAVLVSSALPKLSDRASFERVFRSYPGAGGALARRLAPAIPAVELVLAAALLSGIAWREGALGAALFLLVVNTAYVLRLISTKQTSQCGCGGLIAERQPRSHLAISGALLLFAVFDVNAADTSVGLPTLGPLGGRMHNDPMPLMTALVLGLIVVLVFAAREVWMVQLTIREIDDGAGLR